MCLAFKLIELFVNCSKQLALLFNVKAHQLFVNPAQPLSSIRASISAFVAAASDPVRFD